VFLEKRVTELAAIAAQERDMPVEKVMANPAGAYRCS
jgi:hypothetical protein